MMRGEILEYPYQGTITRVVAGQGHEDDERIVIYSGIMDEHMIAEEEGHTLQTSSYIISMPLTKDDNSDWIVPRKGDEISLSRYGETINFVVDNAEPSQLGGISVYASRNEW